MTTVYSTAVYEIVREMTKDAEQLENNSLKPTTESNIDYWVAKALHHYANRLAIANVRPYDDDDDDHRTFQ